MNILNKLRLAYGLRWKSEYPPIHWREIGMVFVLIGIYGLVAHADDLGDRAAEIERRAAAAERAADIYYGYKVALTNCERGATGYYYPGNTKAFLCPVSVGMSNVR